MKAGVWVRSGLTGAAFGVAAALAVPASAAGQGYRAEAQADALVNRWIEAAGGASVWDEVRDLRYTVTTVWYDEAGKERRRRPRYVWVRKVPAGFQVRVERAEAEGTYVQTWDGARSWATLDGRRLADTTRAVTEIPYVAGDLTYWPGLPWKLHDPGVNLRYVASDPHARGPAVLVTFGDGIGLHDEDRFWWYFGNAASPFPTEVHYIEQGHPPEDRDTARLEDWTSHGPVTYPATRLYYDERGVRTKGIEYSDLRVNTGFPGTVFEATRGTPILAR